MFSISDKLTSSEDDLRYLVNDVEEEHQSLVDKYKSQIDTLMSDLLCQQSLFDETTFAPLPITPPRNTNRVSLQDINNIL